MERVIDNIKRKNPYILRNWITFTLRHQIMLEERKAYNTCNYRTDSYRKFFNKFNYITKEELKRKKLIYDQHGLANKFEKIVTIGKAIASKSDGDIQWKDIM